MKLDRITMWPMNPISGYIYKWDKLLFWRDICTPMFIATVAKIWKEPKYPVMDKWITKYFVYLYLSICLSSIYLSLNTICENMGEPERHCTSEIRQKKTSIAWYNLYEKVFLKSWAHGSRGQNVVYLGL